MRPSLQRQRNRIAHQKTYLGGALIVIAAIGATDVTAASTSASHAPAVEQVGKYIREDVLGTRTALREMLLAAGPDSSVGAYPPSVRQQMLSFYEQREFGPAWTGRPAERGRASEILDVLARAGDQGLRSEDYGSPAQWSGEPAAGKEAAEYELVLTEAVLRYARDVSVGRIRPYQVYEDAQLPDPHFDPVGVLARMLDSPSMSTALADLPPPHAEYQRLVQALARYHDVERKGGWPILPNGVFNLESHDSRVALLIRRLALEDPKLAAISAPSSNELREAVKRFQTRNSLVSDGRVTVATLAALNVPVSARIKQIIANMERWR